MTYGRNGLYIPKDQIMLIPCEKPRNVRDLMEFMRSRKRVLCAKLSRGYGDFVAVLALLYEVYCLTAFSMRGSEVTFDPDPGEQIFPIFFNLKDRETYRKLRSDGREVLKRWDLPKLEHLVEKLLSSSLLIDTKDDFTRDHFSPFYHEDSGVR